MTRTHSENKKYMSQYMKDKYKENIELSREKSLNNYYKNKYSIFNQSKKINNLIDKLHNEILILIENNENCDLVLNEIYEKLNNIMNENEELNEDLNEELNKEINEEINEEIIENKINNIYKFF